MRFTASPLVVAVALGLLNPSVLVDEAQSRARTRVPRSPSSVEMPRPAVTAPTAAPARADDDGPSES